MQGSVRAIEKRLVRILRKIIRKYFFWHLHSTVEDDTMGTDKEKEERMMINVDYLNLVGEITEMIYRAKEGETNE